MHAIGKQQEKIRQLQCPEQRIDHIPYYLSGFSREHCRVRGSAIHVFLVLLSNSKYVNRDLKQRRF